MAQLPARHVAHRAHATSSPRTGAGKQRRVLAGVLHVLTCSVAKVSTHDSSSSSHSPNEVKADCRHSSIQDGLQEDVHGVLGANGTSTQLQENSGQHSEIRGPVPWLRTHYKQSVSWCAVCCGEVADGTLQMLVCCMSTLLGAQIKAQEAMRTARRSMGQ